jgi:hypothetical protein
MLISCRDTNETKNDGKDMNSEMRVKEPGDKVKIKTDDEKVKIKVDEDGNVTKKVKTDN